MKRTALTISRENPREPQSPADSHVELIEMPPLGTLVAGYFSNLETPVPVNRREWASSWSFAS